MNARIKKIKKHFHENKKVYLGVITGVVVGAASATVAIFMLTRSNSGVEIVQKITPVLSWRPESTNVVIKLVEHSTSSKPVHLVGTNLYFNSLSEASRETGHSLPMLSKHINGHVPDLNGDVFELLQPAA